MRKIIFSVLVLLTMMYGYDTLSTYLIDIPFGIPYRVGIAERKDTVVRKGYGRSKRYDRRKGYGKR